MITSEQERFEAQQDLNKQKDALICPFETLMKRFFNNVQFVDCELATTEKEGQENDRTPKMHETHP